MYPYLKSVTNLYGSHFIDEDDITAVCDVLRSSNLTCGSAVDKFEQKLASTVNANYAVSCSNGTTALHLASVAAGVRPGDYVIVPSLTFLATANAPRFCGANVLFCDVDPDNGLITAATLLDSLKRAPQRPVAVYIVDLAGQPSCSAEIHAICQANSMKIIQDASHSLGTTFIANGQISTVGDNKFADFSIFSFHPVKNITTGEGGAITTNDELMYVKLKQLRSHGMLREKHYFVNKDLAFDVDQEHNPWYYEMQQIGYNYRLTDIQAALGLSQLNKLFAFKKIRHDLKQYYDQALAPYAEYIKPIKMIAEANPCWHLCSVLIDFDALKISRAVVMRGLSNKGIGSQVHYIPIHLQPYYKQENSELKLPGTLAYYAKTLSLPLHAHLKIEHVDYIITSLLEILGIKCETTLANLTNS